jgi:hypothetical protein
VTLVRRVREPRRFIQVLAGPRQVGKTTVVRQVLAEVLPSHYATADDPLGRDAVWIEAQWEIGRELAGDRRAALLVLDEFVLGSSPLLEQRGLTESLAGRSELIRVLHWSFSEMREAFGWDLDRFLFFGGYPGAAPLVDDESRWRAYILDSLIETTISRDILLLARIEMPALLRQLFRLGCNYSPQILSYTKMLGQLQDAGNTTTLAHYLELLAGAGMITGLQKFSGSRVRRRGSSPKLLVLNTALMSATAGLAYRDARRDPDVWGRLVETAVGAHLVAGGAEVYYWRERNAEVDFVTPTARAVTAFEVTSGLRKDSLPGLAALRAEYPRARPVLVGGQGVPLEEFLAAPPDRWTRSRP